MPREYSTICGITKDELREDLWPKIEAMAESNKISTADCIERLRKQYDGYHFASDMAGAYNPFSLISALSCKKFGSYWYESGSPTFLVDKFAI